MGYSIEAIENDQFSVQFIRLIRSIATLMSKNVRIIESEVDPICRVWHFRLITIFCFVQYSVFSKIYI